MNMTDIFKTVLILSALGSLIILILTAIKPLTEKYLPARWQNLIWLLACICMLFPFWKIIPYENAVYYTTYFSSRPPQNENVIGGADAPTDIFIGPAPADENASPPPKKAIDIFKTAAYIWLFGSAAFFASGILSYIIFLYKKRKNSIDLSSNTVLEEIKKELKIKRKIKIRISNDKDSPMLTGILFPVIYIPNIRLDEKTEKMIFRHELMHLKCGDLYFKWLTLFVCAVHWFNPLSYILSRNVNQSCEIACDMAVIKNMDEENKKFYMETILNLAEKEKR